MKYWDIDAFGDIDADWVLPTCRKVIEIQCPAEFVDLDANDGVSYLITNIQTVVISIHIGIVRKNVQLEDGKKSVPINAVKSKLARWGKLPVSLRARVGYWVESPETGLEC